MTASSLLFSPYVPVWTLVLAGLAAFALAGWGYARGGVPRLLWHLVPAAAVIVALANPRLAREDAVPLNDIAVIVVDESPSMGLADRHGQAERALSEVTERLKRLAGLDIKVVRHRNAPGRDEGTKLFATLDEALADVPRRRLAGVLMITDGEVADVPASPGLSVPLHVLLAGHANERDRRLVVEKAPSFGIVGGTATVGFRVEDPGHDDPVAVTVRKDGAAFRSLRVAANLSRTIDVPVDHAGSNVVEIEAEAVPGELTTANNRAAVAVSGVRDRLRVLLVSGEPHAGERTWRNLLKADPSVDLVHFTILRPPEKNDMTPLRELALIAFPVKELFEEKLRDFDLVIFDRYRRHAILRPAYYQNLADYVRGGGALLMSVGPEYAQADSPYDTPLSQVLPAKPAGRVVEKPFIPRITAVGRRHPVTAGLPGAESDPPRWGPWARIVGGAVRESGTTVMEGAEGLPLLVLDRVGEGRVAELMSDSAWLWGRGWQGGGPQAELLRRLAHWLMKEPELEEERLFAAIDGDRLEIERRSLTPGPAPVTLKAPDGGTRTVTLVDQGDGRATASVPIDQEGLWRVDDGRQVALAAAGTLNPVEMAELRSTPEKLKPATTATGGGLRPIDEGIPDMRRVYGDDAKVSGSSWFGWRANGDHLVSSVHDIPLIPPALLLLLALGGLGLAYWRQGR